MGHNTVSDAAKPSPPKSTQVRPRRRSPSTATTHPTSQAVRQKTHFVATAVVAHTHGHSLSKGSMSSNAQMPATQGSRRTPREPSSAFAQSRRKSRPISPSTKTLQKQISATLTRRAKIAFSCKHSLFIPRHLSPPALPHPSPE